MRSLYGITLPRSPYQDHPTRSLYEITLGWWRFSFFSPRDHSTRSPYEITLHGITLHGITLRDHLTGSPWDGGGYPFFFSFFFLSFKEKEKEKEELEFFPLISLIVTLFRGGVKPYRQWEAECLV